MRLPRKWRCWLASLWTGCIHGAAGAGSAQLALATGAGLGMGVKPLEWRALGVVMLAATVSSALAFLKQSPLPRPEDDTAFILNQAGVADALARTDAVKAANVAELAARAALATAQSKAGV